MKLRGILLLFLLMTLILTLSLLIKWLLPHPHEAELRAAYELSGRILQEARASGDPSRLSKAFTRRIIPELEKTLKLGPKTSFHQDERVDWIEVVEYNPPEAVIIVKSSTSNPVYNPETNKYDKWRSSSLVIKYRMYQEDGVWKLDKMLEFLGHGP